MHIVFAVQLFLSFFLFSAQTGAGLVMFSSPVLKGVMFPLWFENTTLFSIGANIPNEGQKILVV